MSKAKNVNLSFSEHVGERIKFYRKTKHMTLSELADAIHRSTSTLSKYETGAIPISVDVLFDISKVLNVSVNQLVDYEDEPKVTTPTALSQWKLFPGRTSLYLYYYDGRNKQITKTLLVLNAHKTENNVTPCYCYMDVPSFDQPHKCKYFYNGSVSHYDLLTNIRLTNHAVPMEELNMIIMNPFHHTQKTWGLMLCLSFNPLTPMALKFLVTPNRISLKTQLEKNQLMEELMLTKDEIKSLKSMNMMFLNTQKP